jgi:hypothetical protein
MRQILCLILFLQVLPTAATTVYKSVDERGRVSFSDQPPTQGTLVEITEYSDPTPTTSALDRERLQAMREATDRMAVDRREREASRLAARRLKLEQQAAEIPVEAYYDPPYYVGNYSRHYRRVRPGHGLPGVRPPGVRPPGLKPHPLPIRPVSGPAIVSQYPAKLVRRHYTGAAARVFNPTRRDLYFR